MCIESYASFVHFGICKSGMAQVKSLFQFRAVHNYQYLSTYNYLDNTQNDMNHLPRVGIGAHALYCIALIVLVMTLLCS